MQPKRRNESSAARVRYEGEFELAWLRDGERVMSAGDGTGAAIIVSPDGSERRVNIGDEIPAKSGPGQAPSFLSRRPASETETAGASSSAAQPHKLGEESTVGSMSSPGSSAAQTQGFMLSPGHIDGCFVVETFNSFSPLDFVVYDGTEQRDKIGRRCGEGRGRMWHRFTCQDPKCPAVALVRWDTLAEFVSAPLRPAE